MALMKIFTLIRKYLWWIVLATIFLSLTAFVLYRTGKLPLVNKATEVRITHAAKKDIFQTLSVSGEIAADEHATVRFQTSGLLNWVGVKEGDKVKKYQAIASLDKRQLRKTLDKQMNNYLSERWDFEQTQDDYKTTKDNFLVTDAIKRILDKQQFALNNSVIDYEMQDLTVRLATISTPIEGVVTKVGSPYAGVNITPSEAEFEIVNPSTLYFSADVDETDIAKVFENQEAEIILDAYPDEPIKGRVVSISYTPKAGVSGTAYEVKVSLPTEWKEKMKLSFNGEVLITVKSAKDVLTLPISDFASIEANNKATVKVRRVGKEETITVKTGIVTDDEAEIVSGLSETDEIILSSTNGQKSK